MAMLASPLVIPGPPLPPAGRNCPAGWGDARSGGAQGLSICAQTGKDSGCSPGERRGRCNGNYICREIKNDFKFHFPISQHIPWRYFI